MTTSDNVREGYLVIADISGYTRFVTTTELEHAQSIIGELTELIIQSLAPPLTFVKPEGDAVFCYVDGRVFPDAERVLELIEVCYLQFATRRREMAAATTCTCAACANIGTLDLKFVCHYGAFMMQPVGGVEDLAGPAVVLVHRLLKNSIAERTGSRAYAFFTDACRAHLPSALGLTTHSEYIASIGQVSGGVYDLRPVLEGQRRTAGVYISPADADFVLQGTGLVAPPVIWPYFFEPAKLLQWQADMVAARNEPNDNGRFGLGAVSHCDHGSYRAAHRVVDWRPYRYYTTIDTPEKRSLLAGPETTTTTEFTSGDGGQTTISFRIRLNDRSWLSRLKLRLFAPVIRRTFTKSAKRLAELIERDGLIADR